MLSVMPAVILPFYVRLNAAWRTRFILHVYCSLFVSIWLNERDMLDTLFYSTISLCITNRLPTIGAVLSYRSTSFRYGKVPLFSSSSLEFCLVCCYFPLSDCWSNALLTRFFKSLIQIRDLKMKDLEKMRSTKMRKKKKRKIDRCQKKTDLRHY